MAKRNKYRLTPLFMLFALICPQCIAKEYHIDSQQTFDALSRSTFLAGDTILFRRGMHFDGMFAPLGKGTERAPITIDVYGRGERPRINGCGKHIAGVFLQDPSYWEVNGLEITNTDGTDKDQGQLFGIYVLVKGAEGTYKHIYINDCYIHDVNGKVAGKGRGGIHVHVKGLEATVLHDLRITNNRIVRVGGVGIGNSSSCGRVEFRENDTVCHNLWTKVYVGGNYIDNTGRNNVIARVSKDAIYERNVLANSSRYDTGHSIFCFNTDGIKIQYNEAYGNVGDDGHDRGGYDADYNCVNTFIQYNYSHDNMWFCGIMKRRNRNVVIRYNVSQNDKTGIYFYGFDSERKAQNIHIYNNTHFVGRGFDVSVFCQGRTPINSLFENNIFFFEGQGEWGKKADGINTSFRNNLYFNIEPHGSDTSPIAANPMFVQPGIAGANIDLKTMNALGGYHLRTGSPCIDTGVKISNHGGKDLLGAKVLPGKVDIGAFERQDEARSREELVKACQEKVEKVQEGMQRWASQGHHPFEIRDIMHAEFFPHMKAGRYREAEKVADRVLEMLKKGPAVAKPKDLREYLRKTEETQYIILPIPQVGHLYGGETAPVDQAIKDTIQRLGQMRNIKKRNWGFHLIIPAWRFDPQHSENKRADIARAVRGAFDLAIANNVAVHFTVESHEWSNRPDLWNYADKDKPGYDPKNRANVEWSDWDGTPHPHRYRDWGRPESMPPVICYNSPAVLKEVSRIISEVVTPPLKAGLERLRKEGKEHLFSGVTVGAEPALPNYENIERHNPRIAKLMDQDGSAKTRLGYNALSNNGYSKAKPPRDFGKSLAKVNREYTAYWSRKLAVTGIPVKKMYTHVAAGAGVIGSPGVEFTNAPIEIAFNDYSRPGWTTYPVGPLQPDFEHLYKALAEHGNPHWASTEGGPSLGLPRGKHALSMKDYLARHFDYGATVIVFNTGATSKELSDSLTEGVWGEHAVKAYRAFLNPGK